MFDIKDITKTFRGSDYVYLFSNGRPVKIKVSDFLRFRNLYDVDKPIASQAATMKSDGSGVEFTVGGGVSFIHSIVEASGNVSLVNDVASPGNNKVYRTDGGGVRVWGDFPASGGTPVYVFIKSTGLSEGDIHLSDGTNWNVDKALIKEIDVETSSTDWDLYLLQNDNGFAVDDANIPVRLLVEGLNGDNTIYVDKPYEDEDESQEVHLYLIDNSGANTFDIIITGYELS